ncbi:hydrolase [soil metagenome]
MAIWFSSDYHLGHTNILDYSQRPFANVTAMEDAILDRVNTSVGPEDVLYFLGDFCMGIGRDVLSERVAAYRARIRCRNVHLIWGNHDRREVLSSPGLFASTSDLLPIKAGSRHGVLCHYAMRVWDKSHTGRSFQLYGHDHGTLPEVPSLPAFDVGVDCWNFWPISIEQVIEVLAHKKSGGRAADLTIIEGQLASRNP